MRAKLFRFCMLTSAVALIGIAIYYFIQYLGVSIAVGNNGLKLYYVQSIRALWLGFCLQSLLLGLLFIVAARRPHSVSRPVMVICGLLPILEAVLLFSFVGHFWGMLLVASAALVVLLGAAVWPAPPVKLRATETPVAISPAAPFPSPPPPL
ncbi:MAG: hypothetical protein ABIT36_12435 [Steroidobacteraceae bacterium]